MRVDVKTITNTISKISDITSGDKTIPGVMLDLVKVEGADATGILKVCYTDGHKSLIEEIGVTVEEGDHFGGIVVSYEAISGAVANCQPSGIINVGDIVFTWKEGNIVEISADQTLEVTDAEGNVSGYRKMATKKMAVGWVEPGSDMKSAILVRMKYDDIFNADNFDTFNKAELVDALGRTSTEKGRQIYISSNVQAAFVANQAHVTAVPISKLRSATQEDIDTLAAELSESGKYGADIPDSQKNLEEAIKNFEARVHFSIVLPQNIAKSLIGILNKMDSDEIYIYRQEKYCNIFVDNKDDSTGAGEKVGIWFEMPQASKAHIGSLERYSSLGYKTYQFTFFREFLDNNIKSALSSTKSEKLKLKFTKTQELEHVNENNETVTIPMYSVSIASGSSASSTSDNYSVEADDSIDSVGDIDGKEFNVSLKVLADMLAQLKTPRVALDFNVGEQDSVCVRIAECDDDKNKEAYAKAREGLDPRAITPVQSKLDYRNGVLVTKQYTMLAK